MIDIHSHVLPCVDDGANSLEEALMLLEQCVSQGVDTVICTPHQNKMVRLTEKFRREYEKFSVAAADYNVRICLGAEILYYSGAVHDLQKGELLTLGGSKYVLIEFPNNVTCGDLLDAVYELVIAGYVPIIAHTERYFKLTKKDYFAIRNEGALIQVNTEILNGRHTKKLAKYLLKNELVDFIASDCHDSVNRKVDFQPIKEYVAKKFPKQYAKLFENQDYAFCPQDKK